MLEIPALARHGPLVVAARVGSEETSPARLFADLIKHTNYLVSNLVPCIAISITILVSSHPCQMSDAIGI